MRAKMADLEQDAFKRDSRFVVRLLLVLTVGILAGLWMFAELTGERVAGCAAQAFGGVTQDPGSE
ncbi:MAG: hypothetical protein AB7S26_36190 [Sandaracinaceae bacterium]